MAPFPLLPRLSNTATITIWVFFLLVCNPTSLDFWDLDVSHAEGCIVSKTHFKPSVGTPISILLAATIPNGNKISIRVNFARKKCTREEDYLAQGNILVDRFIDNKYDPDLVNQAFKACLSLTSNSSSASSITSTEVKFITQYNVKHKKMEKII